MRQRADFLKPPLHCVAVSLAREIECEIWHCGRTKAHNVVAKYRQFAGALLPHSPFALIPPPPGSSLSRRIQSSIRPHCHRARGPPTAICRPIESRTIDRCVARFMSELMSERRSSNLKLAPKVRRPIGANARLISRESAARRNSTRFRRQKRAARRRVANCERPIALIF